MTTETESAYFLTVEWCSNGARGIFCNNDGLGFRREESPHTALEMHEILGPFWIILSPKSEPLTEDQVAKFTYWVPLEEYSNKFGIAIKTPGFRGKIQ